MNNRLVTGKGIKYFENAAKQMGIFLGVALFIYRKEERLCPHLYLSRVVNNTGLYIIYCHGPYWLPLFLNIHKTEIIPEAGTMTLIYTYIVKC